MAHYFLFPEKDTTIYSHPDRNELNAGIDEVLTIADEDKNGKKYSSRVLIQFKTDEIVNTLNTKVVGEFSASLNLYATEHSNLAINQILEVYPLAESWDNGTGRRANNPITSNGCSWKFRNNDTQQTAWTISGILGATSSFSSSHHVAGGGIWYTGSGFETSRSYNYGDEADLSFDITSPVRLFYSHSEITTTYPEAIENKGFILKRPESQEFNRIDDGTLNYFGVDTHTIYPPHLDISWDDSLYDTGSATDDKIKKSGDCYVTLRNNKGTYYQGEETTFRLNVRELYPTRRFVTSSNFLDINYFTSKSFYSLVDYATEETVIPFDDHTKLSADAEGMYFKLYMNGLQKERYYKLLFKHENNDGITIYDENYYFKISK
jgi:hypothetical protein